MARVSDFKSQLIGGGARPNQFMVSLKFPQYVLGGSISQLQGQFMCKAAQLPASTLENIVIPYRGRVVNVAGERTFENWQISVYNDTNFGIRNAFERWSDGIQNNAASTGRVSPSDYQVDMTVVQLDRNGAHVKTYKFVDAYPSSIGAIGLDFDNTNQIEQFDVVFTFNYWTSNTTSGAAGFGVSAAVDTPLGTFALPI